MTYAKKTQSNMYAKYCNEYPEFKQKLYYEKYKQMFEYIESKLLNQQT